MANWQLTSPLILSLTPILALGAPGCGGASVQKPTGHTRVQTLETSARADRRKIRNLEHELARLESQLRKPQPTSAPNDDEFDEIAALDDGAPELPVEVLEPDLPETLGDAGAPEQEDYEVVGRDEDGLEIVYVGDAAEDRSVKPNPTYLRRRTRPPTRAAARRPTGNQRAHRSAAAGAGPAWDAVTDRLEVTDEIGPTVARQLAAARQGNHRDTAPRRVSEPAPRAPAPKPAKRPVEKSEDTSGPIAEYNRYYRALRAGNHAFAITGFGHFIERHPKHPYADNARYWLAEAFYDQREYQRALDEFNKVLRDYPDGNKVPDALLKIAYCHISLGHTAKARAVLTELSERFPRSRPALLGAKRRVTLDQD